MRTTQARTHCLVFLSRTSARVLCAPTPTHPPHPTALPAHTFSLARADAPRFVAPARFAARLGSRWCARSGPRVRRRSRRATPLGPPGVSATGRGDPCAVQGGAGSLHGGRPVDDHGGAAAGLDACAVGAGLWVAHEGVVRASVELKKH